MEDLEQNEMPALLPEKKGEYWFQDIVVLNKHGMHARPSAKFFEQVLQPYGNDLDLSFHIHGKHEEGSFMQIASVFDLMSLGLEMGTRVTLKVKFLGDGSEFDDENPEESILKNIHSLFLNDFMDKVDVQE